VHRWASVCAQLPARRLALLVLPLMLGLPALQAAATSLTPPAAPIASAERKLLAEAVAVMLFVVVPVFVLTPWVAWRYRRRNPRSRYQPEWSFSWLLEVLIWGVPAIVVTVLGYKVWTRTQALDPYRRLTADTAPLEVQVVGLDWKWLFIYPEQHIATVNAPVFPVGRPVHLQLTSDSVMVSLLMPRLAGQIYAMPGMTTQLSLQADKAGRYLGENTQYNGSGFANQRFTAQAMPPQDFAAWVQGVRANGERLDAARYAKVAARAAQDQPLYFSQVQDGLFDGLVAKYHGHSHLPANHPPAGEAAHGH